MTAAEVQASRLVDRLAAGEKTSVLWPVGPARRAETRRAIEREAVRRGLEVYAIYRRGRHGARIEAFALPPESA